MRVVELNYGVEWGSEGPDACSEGRGCWSGWWRDVVRYSFGDQGEWFKGRLERVVRDGKDINFWDWVGGESLKQKISRLLNINLDKEERICETREWEEVV